MLSHTHERGNFEDDVYFCDEIESHYRNKILLFTSVCYHAPFEDIQSNNYICKPSDIRINR